MWFTRSHEWLSTDGMVGITSYAQKELGEVVYIQLPTVGQQIQAGEAVCVLESTKAAVDVYAPISGKIVAINGSLVDTPALVNESPEKKGWLFQIAPIHLDECKELLSQIAYKSMIGSA